MLVYRITLAKYSTSLQASGNPARWNSKDVKIIYTASSRALACLENVVHRSSVGLNLTFRTIIIDIPEEMKITVLDKRTLKVNWHVFHSYPYTQSLGDEWVTKQKSAVLQVPSVIIAEEFNYLLNPAHSDFKKIKLFSTEHFEFDPRIKEK